MHKYLFIALILLACNQKSSTKSGYSDWSVNNGVATAMIQSANGPVCNNFQFTDSNHTIMKEIDAAYGADKYSRSWIEARFLPNADEVKYRKLRGLPPGSPKGNIRGYCTKLYVITPLNKTTDAEVYYYDIATVCPPPPDCTGDTTKTQQ